MTVEGISWHGRAPYRRICTWEPPSMVERAETAWSPPYTSLFLCFSVSLFQHCSFPVGPTASFRLCPSALCCLTEVPSTLKPWLSLHHLHLLHHLCSLLQRRDHHHHHHFTMSEVPAWRPPRARQHSLSARLTRLCVHSHRVLSMKRDTIRTK